MKCFILDLPNEIIQHTVKVGRLDPREVSFFRATCTTIYNCVDDTSEIYRKKRTSLIFSDLAKKHYVSLAIFIISNKQYFYTVNDCMRICARRGLLNELKFYIGVAIDMHDDEVQIKRCRPYRRFHYLYLTDLASVANCNDHFEMYEWIQHLVEVTQLKPDAILKYIK